MAEEADAYRVGVMKVRVGDGDPGAFDALVGAAADRVGAVLHRERVDLRVEVVEFDGPHLTPREGAFAPLDFLELGLSEKVERQFQFLLLVTDVDLTPARQSYVLALPSQLTNIGVLSTKRLRPEFWGGEPDPAATEARLVALLLHTLGHLLNSSHHPSQTNVMHDFARVEDLEQMVDVQPGQAEQWRRSLPREARDRTAAEHRVRHGVAWMFANLAGILRSVARANPLVLALRLPTMFTAAFSLMIVAFFTAEIWDVASSSQLYDLIVFSIVSVVAATAVLYRAYALHPRRLRSGVVSESRVVTTAATVTGLVATVVVFYAFFFALVLFGAHTIFPEPLMETWPTVDPARGWREHVRLATFVAALGVLAGSLGGAAERGALVRQILFLDEET